MGGGPSFLDKLDAKGGIFGGGVVKPDPFYQDGPVFGKTNVPEGTIKKGFNVYSERDFKGLLDPNVKIDRDNSKCAGNGKNCDGGLFRNADVFTADGKLNNGKHRDKCCVTYKPFQGHVKDCNNCEFKGDGFGFDSDAKPGFISGFKVPVGMYLTAYGESQEAGCSGPKTFVGWGHDTEKSLSNVWPYVKIDEKNEAKKLPDDMAVGCSGGWDMGQNQWTTTTNNFKFKNVPNSDVETNECWTGVNPPAYEDRIGCTEAGVLPKIFCQMGDYVVSTDLCQKECDGVTIGSNKTGGGGKGKDFCRFALDRYCGVVPGEAYKRDSKGNLVTMKDGYYPLFDEDKCIEYCVGSDTDDCHKIKRKVCTSNLEDWKTNPKLVTYCKSYWSNNLDKPFMTNAYKSILTDSSNDQNIMTEKGLGKLCDAKGTNVDESWCQEMKKLYCTASDDNMLTDECYEFCAHPANADQCDDYVKGMCRNRLNVTNEDDMLKQSPHSIHNIGSWCGCMMGSDFYRQARNEKLKRFDELGYDIRGETDLTPECEYPFCKEGAIKTSSQQGRLDNKECKDCVQTMLTSLNSSTFVNSDINQQALSQCGKIIDRSEVEHLAPGLYNMKSTNEKYKVDSDKTYCKYGSEEVFQEDLEKNFKGIVKDFNDWPTSEYVQDNSPCAVGKPFVASRSSLLAGVKPFEEMTPEEQGGYGFLIAFAIIAFLVSIGVAVVVSKKSSKRGF